MKQIWHTYNSGRLTPMSRLGTASSFIAWAAIAVMMLAVILRDDVLTLFAARVFTTSFLVMLAILTLQWIRRLARRVRVGRSRT